MTLYGPDGHTPLRTSDGDPYTSAHPARPGRPVAVGCVIVDAHTSRGLPDHVADDVRLDMCGHLGPPVVTGSGPAGTFHVRPWCQEPRHHRTAHAAVWSAVWGKLDAYNNRAEWPREHVR